MADEWIIEEPARRDRTRACRLVVAGRCPGEDQDRQGDALARLIDLREPSETWLRWARRSDAPDQPAGAVLVLTNPGKVGMALHSAPAQPGMNTDALARALEVAAGEALQAGLSLVQSIPPPDAPEDVAVLKAAGFGLLAELLYMRRDLRRRDLPGPEPRAELTVEQFGEYSEDELAAVIAASYENSFDCPGLAELRRMEDVLEGHRATGIFSPETWWLVRCGGKPAGCVLVNESFAGEAQMVYLGVVPSQRGRGLAEWMTKASMQACRRKGLTAMTLAVDRRNAVAERAYRSAGLDATETRKAFIKH
jgi:ribosomal protein S18 acetylase RimI-like enzyme